jgi:hypothetical protein
VTVVYGAWDWECRGKVIQERKPLLVVCQFVRGRQSGQNESTSLEGWGGVRRRFREKQVQIWVRRSRRSCLSAGATSLTAAGVQ